MRTKRTRNRGFGEYHRVKREETENRILATLNFYSRKGISLSIRSVHKITNIEMKTLRSTLTRMVKDRTLREDTWVKRWNSKKYCIFRLKDHVDFCELIVESHLTYEEAKTLFSESFTKNKDGFMVRK